MKKKINQKINIDNMKKGKNLFFFFLLVCNYVFIYRRINDTSNNMVIICKYLINKFIFEVYIIKCEYF